MKTLGLPLLICLAFGSATLARSQADTKTPFSIVIENDKPTVVAGSKVYIRIKQTNTSDQDVSCFQWDQGGADLMYMYDVRDQNGQSMAIDYAKRFRYLGASARPCTLAPGESTLNREYLISSVNDLSKPGTYTVQVSRYIGPDEKHGTVYSNKITLRVVPREETPSAQNDASTVVENGSNSKTETPTVAPDSVRDASTAKSVPAAQLVQPSFALSITEDKGTESTDPSLHRIQVRYTRTAPGVEIEQFPGEAKGMYDLTVLRDGVPVGETPAMRDLKQLRKLMRWATIKNPRTLESGQSWVTPLDVSDYYDMTRPGRYEVTVTRLSTPLFPAYGIRARSNSLVIDVPPPSSGQPRVALAKPKPKFALNISQIEIAEGAPVMIGALRENTSDTIIRERRCWVFMDMFNLVVLRNGEQLEPKQQMIDLQNKRAAVDCPANETLSEIEPGKADGDRIPVGNFYDIGKPGSYVVYVTRETDPWNPAKSVLVESNPISFVVNPPDPNQVGVNQLTGPANQP
jgi:hypothetical protein